MTVTNVAGFARDAGERAVKTAIQSAAAFGVLELEAFEALFTSGAFELPDRLLILGPIVVTALSVATSWLSRFRGDPNSASGSKVV